METVFQTSSIYDRQSIPNRTTVYYETRYNRFSYRQTLLTIQSFENIAAVRECVYDEIDSPPLTIIGHFEEEHRAANLTKSECDCLQDLIDTRNRVNK